MDADETLLEHLLTVSCDGIDKLAEFKARTANYEQDSGDVLAEEYLIEAEHYDQLLNSIGISYDKLPQETREKIEKLVDLSILLGNNDCHSGSLNNAHLRMSAKATETKYLKESMESKIAHLEEIKRLAEQRFAVLERSVSELNDQKENAMAKVFEWQDNIEVLKKKQKDYEKRLKALKNELNNHGVEDSLRVTDLQKTKMEVEEMRKKLEVKIKQLNAYAELPADLTLAKVKLEQKKAELEELAEKRNEYLKKLSATLL